MITYETLCCNGSPLYWVWVKIIDYKTIEVESLSEEDKPTLSIKPGEITILNRQQPPLSH